MLFGKSQSRSALHRALGLLASRLPGLIYVFIRVFTLLPFRFPKGRSQVLLLFFLVVFVFFILFFQLKKFYTLIKCCFPFAVKTSVVLSYFPDCLVSAPSIVHE